MATTNTVVLSVSDFLTKLDYHNKRKSLVADGYKVTGSTKTNVTLVKEVAAPSRRNATPSRRRAPSAAPAPVAAAPAPAPTPVATPTPVAARRNATPSRRRAPAPAPATPAPAPEPTPAPAATPARSGRGRAGRR